MLSKISLTLKLSQSCLQPLGNIHSILGAQWRRSLASIESQKWNFALALARLENSINFLLFKSSTEDNRSRRL